MTTTRTLPTPPTDPPPKFPPLTYSKSPFTRWLLKDSSSGMSSLTQTSSSTTTATTTTLELIQLLALNALEFTAPAVFFSSSDKKGEEETASSEPPPTTTPTTKRELVQLSGHRGTFAPAGPTTLWKRLPPRTHPDVPPSEALVYLGLFGGSTPNVSAAPHSPLGNPPKDSILPHLPPFYSHTHYASSDFIELEDLTTRFDPKTLHMLDVKLGTRTFLESEVSNPSPRPDLFTKFWKLVNGDESYFNEIELVNRTLTKYRYMTLRESLSSTNELGFRIDGVKLPEKTLEKELNSKFPRMKDKDEIREVFRVFAGGLIGQLRERLITLKEDLERSEFFATHEVIGCSLLMIRDGNGRLGVWMIDWAKAVPLEKGKRTDHRGEWRLGNREDGVVVGVEGVVGVLS